MWYKEFSSLNDTLRILGEQKKRTESYLNSLNKKIVKTFVRVKGNKGFNYFAQRLSHDLFKDTTSKRLKLIKVLLAAKSSELKIIALFILAEYGKDKFEVVSPYFKKYALFEDAKVRLASAIAFRKVVDSNRSKGLAFLKRASWEFKTMLDIFICEVLRPVKENRWLLAEPEKSLKIMNRYFKSSDKELIKVLAKNLAELAKKQPEFMFNYFKNALAKGNLRTYWLVYKGARALVQNNDYRKKTLKLLKVNEYNYRGQIFR